MNSSSTSQADILVELKKKLEEWLNRYPLMPYCEVAENVHATSTWDGQNQRVFTPYDFEVEELNIDGVFHPRVVQLLSLIETMREYASLLEMEEQEVERPSDFIYAMM